MPRFVKRFAAGAPLEFRAVFTGSDGQPVSPDTMTFKTIDPDDEITTYVYGASDAIVEESDGVFLVTLANFNTAGVWQYRFEGNGEAHAVAEGSFEILMSKFVN